MPESEREFSIFDDSGMLSLLDSDRYSTYISADWSYSQLISHVNAQMRNRSILTWECSDGGGLYRVKVRHHITRETGFREVLGSVVVSSGRLNLVSCDALTMAAQFKDFSLPSCREASLYVRLEPGAYQVRLVQTYDPTGADISEDMVHFIVELEAGEAEVWDDIPWRTSLRTPGNQAHASTGN